MKKKSPINRIYVGNSPRKQPRDFLDKDAKMVMIKLGPVVDLEILRRILADRGIRIR